MENTELDPVLSAREDIKKKKKKRNALVLEVEVIVNTGQSPAIQTTVNPDGIWYHRSAADHCVRQPDGLGSLLSSWILYTAAY